VEFASPYEHPPEAIAERLERHGLRCILFNLPMGDKSKGDFGIACRPGREDEFREGVARALDYAKALRCSRINCIAGRIFAGEDREVLIARLVANLRFAARAFKSAGIELVVEPLNDRDNPDFLVPTSPQMAKVIEAVDESNVGLQCDIYHTAMMGDDPATILEALRPLVRHVQFADVPGRGEPGTGRIDMQSLFVLLDRLGYDGWVSAEYRPSAPYRRHPQLAARLKLNRRTRDTEAARRTPLYSSQIGWVVASFEHPG
jgi:hydroxypyruvate isomerase